MAFVLTLGCYVSLDYWQKQRVGALPMDHGHERLTCSFCGRGRHETRKLIAGPALYICDVCVAQGSGIAVGGDAGAPELSKVEILGGVPGTAAAHCSFCGRNHDSTVTMVTDRTRAFRICGECLGLCRDILAEDAKAAP